MIKKSSYKDFKIYYKVEKYKELAKKILDKEYLVIFEYKNTERNYVAKIEVNGSYYVLKSPKAETVIPQRKLQTMFKKGEALTSFFNIDYAIKSGLNLFIEPLSVMVRRGVFLKESFILMEYVEGKPIKTAEEIDEIMNIVEKIHKMGIYHGDLNTSNFIKAEDSIKIIDTQAKREKFWYFKRGYDILTMKNDLLVLEKKYEVEKKYRVNRDLGYSLAYFIKNFKKLSLVKKVREIKVKLRTKGWKV
ncbi:lipopolysaccharide core heptose(II) kinase RfaY [Cetobacterium sp.]|uniref:lipopolysaccharide core heptose(II) kinase RfaY n=1 Tax=Cetobacterium sp. TaxID=2071632 RepID=UPI003F4077A8